MFQGNGQLPSNSRDDSLGLGHPEDRKWTSQHINAADLPRDGPASSVTDLTPPPQVDLNEDVNARGPGK